MKQPFKLHRGPGECIGASRALYIDKLDHAALISFCYSAVRRNEGHIWLKLPRDCDFYETWIGLFLTVAVSTGIFHHSPEF